jgi:opacity protein-like surface antigen
VHRIAGKEMALIQKLIAAAALALLPAIAAAQASPAIRIPPSLTAGGYYSNFTPDYTPNRLGGMGIFVDLNLFLHGKLGAEGEARWLRFNQLQGSYQDNYLAGPRYSRRYGKFVPYVKFMMGAGEFEFPNNQGHGGYFAYAPGGGLDYRLTRHLTIRAIDYEYQRWPSAPGGGLPTNGMTPNGFSFGLGYKIF